MAQQMGMQMPGAGGRRRPAMNIYTGLAFLAVVCLGVAVALVWISGAKLGPADANPAMRPLTVQDEGSIRLG